MTTADKPAGLNWLDPDAVAAWLRDVETYVKDLVEVAEDQTDKPRKRLHGRKGARRAIKAARTSLLSQLAHARAGLP